MNRPRSSARSIPGADSGAVALEFLICFVPTLTLFFATCEFCMLSTAHLFVKHSAMVAARAAAVLRLPNPNELADVTPFDTSAYSHFLAFPARNLCPGSVNLQDPWTLGYYEPTDCQTKEYCTAHPTDEKLCARDSWNATYDSNDVRKNMVCLAAERAVYPWYPHILGLAKVHCDPKETAADSDAAAMEKCTVTSAYKCLFPFSSALMCSGGVRPVTATASFPHQGAYYKPEFGW